MAGGHPIEERAGEEGGGVWCKRMEPSIPYKEVDSSLKGLSWRQLTFDPKHI